MGVQFYFQTDEPLVSAGPAELDRVVLAHAATALDGANLAQGARGTIVSVHGDGAAYTIEFRDGTLAMIAAECVLPA